MIGAGPLGRLVEREQELSRLRAALEGAQAGTGHLVLVDGPPGVGKTALLGAATAEARGLGLFSMTARGAELERDWAFGVVRQWLEPAVRRLDAHGREAAFAGPAGLVRELAGLPGVGAGPESGHAVLNALYWLLANLAEREPLAIVLDDAQWADAASLRALAFLAGRLEDLPAAVVVARRAGEPSATLDALAVEPVVEILRPEPFSVEAVERLLVQAHGGEVPEDLVAALHEATGGSPLLVAQVARAVAAHGLPDDAAALTAAGGDAVAPWARAQLARLPPDASGLARALAVLTEADLPLARRVAHLDPERAVVALEALVAVGLVDDVHPLRLRHPLMCSAIALGIEPSGRAELHRRAAAALAQRNEAPERIAGHLAATPGRGSEPVVRILRDCASRAMARGAPEAAVAALTRALQEPPADAGRAAVLLELAAAQQATGSPDAAASYRRAYDEARDPAIRSRAAQALPWCAGSQTDFDDVARRLATCLSELGQREPELSLGLEAGYAALAMLDPTRRVTPQQLARWSALPGHTRAEAELLAFAARWLMDSGRPAREVATAAERAARVPARDMLSPDSLWFLNVCVTLHVSERPEALADHLDWALAVARSRASARGFAIASAFRSQVFLRQGRVRDAEADAWAAAEVDAGEATFRLRTYTQVVDSLVEAGRAQDARALLAENGLMGTIPAARPFTQLFYARARMWAELGDTEPALADLDEAARRAGRSSAAAVIGLDGALLRSRLLDRLGRRTEAVAAAEEGLERAGRWGSLGHQGAARRCAALLREGDEQVDGLRAALALLDGSPAGLERLEALVDLGAALRRAGRRVEARGPLRAAVAEAAANGAVRIERRAADELRATGERLPRRPRGGPDALTPSEARVAGMAAQGMSNPEIAQALFVTRKAVEMHLVHVYRKLGVKTRHHLAAALALPEHSPAERS